MDRKNKTDNLTNYRWNMTEIGKYFKVFGLGFEKKDQKLVSFIYAMTQSALVMVFLLYCIIYQPSEMFVKIQQFWGAVAMAQVLIKGFNWKWHWKRIDNLLKWFEWTYAGEFKDEYQKLLEKRQALQNKQIKMAIYLFKFLGFLGAFFYLLQPLVLGNGGLPTPITWNGISEDEFAWPVFYSIYAVYVLNAYIVVHFLVPIESFYVFCILILGHRFASIGNILSMLNYKGERDRRKDHEIICDAVKWHVEVFE